MKGFEINFEVSAIVTQEINIIDNSYTPETIQKLLTSGDLVTTLSHGRSKVFILTTKDLKPIAEIIMQYADGEYLEFDLN